MRSSIETFETAMRATTAQQQLIDQNKVADATGFPELQAAVEELTAVLRRLSELPESTEERSPLAAEPVSHRKIPAPRLARELQQLLQEIDAARLTG